MFYYFRHIPRVLEDKEEKIPIDCMVAFSKGLIIGCDGGNFVVWMKTDDPDINFGTGKEKSAD
jgi:cilia- and flagella-associated protein 57